MMVLKKIKMFGSLLFLVVVLVAMIGVVVGFDTVREFFTQASGYPANIEVKVDGVLGPMPKPWKNLAQGGESRDFRIAPISAQVKALAPEYVRIDHIYDFYDIVNRNGDGSLSFSFEKMDPILDDIAAVGAKPFISLSYMPPTISDGDIVNKPRDWNEWQLTVQKTIEHISGAPRNTDGVYYEVWNEPDLFGGWKTYGDKNYLELYRRAAMGAANAKGTRAYKLGGPAITAFYPAWFESFLKFASERNLRVDFVSWHRYNYDVDVFLKDFEDMEKVLEKYPAYLFGTEKLITEWGHDPANHSGYDTGFSAAHTVAVASEFPAKINRAFLFEIQDGRDPEGKQMWGRWGVLTHGDGGVVAKPRYTAMQWLNLLGDERLSMTGKGSWVRGMAAKKGETVQVLLSNYDQFGKNYEKVPVTFSGIVPGDFVIKQRFLGGGLKDVPVATTEAKLKYEVGMPANSVVMLELTRK